MSPSFGAPIVCDPDLDFDEEFDLESHMTLPAGWTSSESQRVTTDTSTPVTALAPAIVPAPAVDTAPALAANRSVSTMTPSVMRAAPASRSHTPLTLHHPIFTAITVSHTVSRQLHTTPPSRSPYTPLTRHLSSRRPTTHAPHGPSLISFTTHRPYTSAFIIPFHTYLLHTRCHRICASSLPGTRSCVGSTVWGRAVHQWINGLLPPSFHLHPALPGFLPHTSLHVTLSLCRWMRDEMDH